MIATQPSPSPEWAAFRKNFLFVAAFVASLLLLLWLGGYGPSGAACRVALDAAAPAAAQAAAPVAAAVPAAAVPAAAPAAGLADAAAAVVADRPPPAARLLFASGKTDLPGTADRSLQPLAAYLKEHPQAVATVVGFHDASGSAVRNAELAKLRAAQTRDALQRLGVQPRQVVMSKPSATTGSGGPAQARRVEVSITPA